MAGPRLSHRIPTVLLGCISGLVAIGAVPVQAETKGGPVRVGAVQAFETPDGVMILAEVLGRDPQAGLFASGSRWHRVGVARLTVSARSVTFRRLRTRATVHPNSATVFGHAGDVFAYESPHALGGDSFRRFTGDRLGEVGDGEKAELLAALGVDATAGWREVEQAIEAYRERSGWRTLLIERQSAMPMGDGGEDREPRTLRPTGVPAAITLDYDRRVVLVIFYDERGDLTDEIEVRLVSAD